MDKPFQGRYQKLGFIVGVSQREMVEEVLIGSFGPWGG